MRIWGYKRENGQVGIRNHVLIMSVTRGSHLLSNKVGEHVVGTKVFVPEDEDGRSKKDRETISRVLIGLGCNPNVHSVLLVCNDRSVAYSELNVEYIAEEMVKSQKRVEILSIEESDGFYSALGDGIKLARELVVAASEVQREEVDFGELFIGVKCGLSDATSGIAGNPTVGYMADELIDRGGTFVFSETTEVIGAEQIIAKRCKNDEIKQAFLSAVEKTEEEAKSTGEDIRTINPIPANIQAGITTLEEKSLGAIEKAGHKEIAGVIEYAEKPNSNGLFFMDSWMSSTSLFLGYASSGAVLGIFQMGGNCLPKSPVIPAAATGIVMPILYVTGNPRTYLKGEMDFNAGTVIENGESITETGERLCEYVQKIASGKLTIAETLKYQDRVEIFLQGPKL